MVFIPTRVTLKGKVCYGEHTRFFFFVFFLCFFFYSSSFKDMVSSTLKHNLLLKSWFIDTDTNRNAKGVCPFIA